jgi:hypothetical protein
MKIRRMSTAVTPPTQVIQPTVLPNSVPIVSSPPYMSFIFLMILFIFLFFLLEQRSSAAHTSDDWSNVRCEPQNMLLAGLYGHDPNENFQFCLQQIIQDSTKSSTAPFAQGMGGFTSVLQNLMSSANSFRTTLATMAGGIIKIIGEFKARMTALMGRVKLTASRMKAMMYRLYGTMFAVMYMGISAQTGIANFGDTFIFKFIDTFCFAPDTRVVMADGSESVICGLRVGDVLAGKSVVEAIIECPGSNDMYEIYGIRVSGRHRIWSLEESKFISVKDHPDAKKSYTEDKLWTLITSNREIPVKGLDKVVRFADWEELPDTDEAAASWDAIVQQILNKEITNPKVPTSAPCIDKSVLVYKHQAGLTPIGLIQTGDWIQDSGLWVKVMGRCERQVRTAIGTLGNRITDGMWIEDMELGIKRRWVHPTGAIKEGSWKGMQLITTSGAFDIYIKGSMYRVRDFTEVGTERLAESFKKEDQIHAL